jgi:transposase
MLLADRGYDADWIRTLAAEKGAWANIPPRCNCNDPICFSPYLYRARNMCGPMQPRSSWRAFPASAARGLCCTIAPAARVE